MKEGRSRSLIQRRGGSCVLPSLPLQTEPVGENGQLDPPPGGSSTALKHPPSGHPSMVTLSPAYGALLLRHSCAYLSKVVCSTSMSFSEPARTTSPSQSKHASSLTISTYALVRSALFQCVQFSDSNPHCVKILNSVCFFSVVFPYFRYVAWVSVWAWVSADKVNVHVSLFCCFDGVVCSRW